MSSEIQVVGRGIRTYDKFNPAAALPQCYYDKYDERYERHLAPNALGIIRCIVLGYAATERPAPGQLDPGPVADLGTVTQQGLLRYHVVLAPEHARVLANIAIKAGASLRNVTSAAEFVKLLSRAPKRSVCENDEDKVAYDALRECVRAYPQNLNIADPPPPDLDTIRATEWYQYAHVIDINENPLTLPALGAGGDWPAKLERFEATEDPVEEAHLLQELQALVTAQSHAAELTGGRCQGVSCPVGQEFKPSEMYLSAYAPDDGDKRYLCVACAQAAAFGKHLDVPLAVYKQQEEDAALGRWFWSHGGTLPQLLSLVQLCQGPYCEHDFPGTCMVAPREVRAFGGHMASVTYCCYRRLLPVYEATIATLNDQGVVPTTENPVLLPEPERRMPLGMCADCGKGLHNYRAAGELFLKDETGTSFICRWCLHSKIAARGGRVLIPSRPPSVSREQCREIVDLFVEDLDGKEMHERISRLAWTVAAPDYLPAHMILDAFKHSPKCYDVFTGAMAIKAAERIVSEYRQGL